MRYIEKTYSVIICLNMLALGAGCNSAPNDYVFKKPEQVLVEDCAYKINVETISPNRHMDILLTSSRIIEKRYGLGHNAIQFNNEIYVIHSCDKDIITKDLLQELDIETHTITPIDDKLYLEKYRESFETKIE